MSARIVYLDHASSAPVLPDVARAVAQASRTLFGNPHNRTHEPGRRAFEAVDQAAVRISRCLGGAPRGVVLTSGASESNNLALAGWLSRRPGHVITASTEHKSVLESLRALVPDERLTVLDVDREGRIRPSQIEQALRPDTTLVSLMWANNEIGTRHPIEVIGPRLRQRGVCLHTDATQAVGKLEIDVERACVDLLSLSGHKIYGPQGTGVLWVRPGLGLEPQIRGGDQQEGRRAGTVSVAGAVGLGIACERAGESIGQTSASLAASTEALWERIARRDPSVVRISPREGVVPGILNLAFEGVDAHALLELAVDVAASPGAACSAEAWTPSHVLRAIGVPDDRLGSCVRLSPGRHTTSQDLEQAAKSLCRAAAEVRRLSFCGLGEA